MAQDTSELSNPSHHWPFISPPAEFIIPDFTSPLSQLRLLVVGAFKDSDPSTLSQYTLGIMSSLQPILSRSPSPSLPTTFPRCALAPGTVSSCDLHLSTVLCLINAAASPGHNPDPAAPPPLGRRRGHTWPRQRGIQMKRCFFSVCW